LLHSGKRAFEMDIAVETLTNLSPWTWVIFGMILCAAEMAAPGSFVVWVGLGAISTGVVLAIAPPLGLWALIAFAFFSLAFSLAGYRLFPSHRARPVDTLPEIGA
jgi:inner membrane protein